MIKGRGNRKRPFEGERSSLIDEFTFLAIPRNRLTDEPIIWEGRIEDHQVRRILVDGKSSSEIMYGPCCKNLNVNIRSRLRRCIAPLIDFLGETYHPLGISNYGRGKKEQNGTDGVYDSKMSFVVQRHNRKDQNEKPQSGSWKEVQLRHREEKMSKIKEQAILRTKSSSGHGPNQGITLTTDCKWLLTIALQENIEVFSWSGSEETTVPRFVIEHQLKIYLLAEPVVHKRRPMTPDERQALKERVFCWLKKGTIRKVQHPEWVSNTIHVKVENGT
nr:hypothetical protein [Tanacetum cinerariifolium]